MCCSLYAAVKVVIAAGIFMTYGIQFYIPIEILWPSLEQRLKHGSLVTYGEYLLRYFFLFVTCTFSTILWHFPVNQYTIYCSQPAPALVARWVFALGYSARRPSCCWGPGLYPPPALRLVGTCWLNSTYSVSNISDRHRWFACVLLNLWPLELGSSAPGPLAKTALAAHHLHLDTVPTLPSHSGTACAAGLVLCRGVLSVLKRSPTQALTGSGVEQPHWSRMMR